MKNKLSFPNTITFTLLFVGIIIFSSCGSTTKTIAVEDGWELLGDTKAGYIRETDVINVTSRNQFTALKFRVEGQQLKLNSLGVYFDNGDKLSPAVSDIITPGTESRIIELGAQGRYISKIELRYRSDGKFLSKKAKVYVFGRRYHVGY